MRHFFFVFLLCSAAVHAAPQLAINTGFKPPVSDIYRLIMEDAFARADLSVDFREVAAERSIALANDGVDDGDCCRIWEVDSLYPNLVRVPVPVIQVDFVAFVKNADLRLSGSEDWAALAPFEVGVVSGWKILETGLEKTPPRYVYSLSSPQSLFAMLARERIQVATIGRLVGYQTLLDMKLSGVRVVEPPLVSRPLYLFLHKKHAELVPRLTETLETMRGEGALSGYYRRIVAPLEAQLEQLR